MPPGRKGSLEPRDGGRLRSHSFCNLRLGQTCLPPRLKQGIQQHGFFALDTYNFGSYARTAQEFPYDLIMCLHV